MDFTESQKDMNLSYVCGVTGVLVSGVVWTLAGIIGITISNVASMTALLVGGMFIFPLSVILSKIMSASGKHSSENSLRHLALETLPVLFGGLLIAFYVSQFKIELFFPIMLLIIGSRYSSFQTLYGLKEYWLLGTLLMIAGIVFAISGAPFIVGAFAGGILEVIFGLVLVKKGKAILSVAVQKTLKALESLAETIKRRVCHFARDFSLRITVSYMDFMSQGKFSEDIFNSRTGIITSN